MQTGLKEEDIILKAENLSREFVNSKGKKLKACSNININVYKGKTLGIVGESGCGKSTLVKMLMQIIKPSSGKIIFHGEDITNYNEKQIWENRQKIQMVFQDPFQVFNPKMKIEEIITEPLLNYKRIKKSEKKQIAEKLLELVNLPKDCLYKYPHNLSGGQRQRISIARAVSIEPEILICDESTSALDVITQKKIIELLIKLQKEKDISIIFICHDLALIQAFADEINVMYLGNIVEKIQGKRAVNNADHPYTKALADSVFSVHKEYREEIKTIKGEIPSPVNVPEGCPFNTRCPKCMEKCVKEKPELKETENGHYVRCFLELHH